MHVLKVFLVLLVPVAVALHSLDILVHVGVARGLAEHDPPDDDDDDDDEPVLCVSHLSASG